MLFISQVIISEVMVVGFFFVCFLAYLYSMGTQTREPASGRQGDLFYSVGLHRNHVLATANKEKIGRGLEKMQVNGTEG